MDYESIKGIGSQIRGIWRGLAFYQRLSILSVIVILLTLFTYIIIGSSYPDYVQLFPNEKLQLADSEEITSYLNTTQTPYKIDANASILVPVQDVQKVRADLTTLGIPKGAINRGYDLFDSSTWIRGEKELQILEIRALKGQLEQDLAQFDNIRSASVILDIAPSRPFGASHYQTKASVILNLVPGATLPQSEIEAISFHVAGAVRGLTPNMVAISDTTGRLYRGWNAEVSSDKGSSIRVSLEDQIKGKVDGLLSLIAGPGRYFSTVQILSGKAVSPLQAIPIEAINISIILDQSLISSAEEKQMREDIERQIKTILEPYRAQVNIQTGFASFNKGAVSLAGSTPVPSKKNDEANASTGFWRYADIVIAAALIAALLAAGGVLAWALYYFSRKNNYNRIIKADEQKKRDIDLELMLESLKEHVRNNPRKMAEEISAILKEQHQEQK